MNFSLINIWVNANDRYFFCFSVHCGHSRMIFQVMISGIISKIIFYLFLDPSRNFLHVKLNSCSRTKLRHLELYSRPEVFCKKGVLRNFTKFTGKHLYQSLFFNKVAGRPATNVYFDHHEIKKTGS